MKTFQILLLLLSSLTLSEAKVYLDTPHVEVPGYHPLDGLLGQQAADL